MGYRVKPEVQAVPTTWLRGACDEGGDAFIVSALRVANRPEIDLKWPTDL